MLIILVKEWVRGEGKRNGGGNRAVGSPLPSLRAVFPLLLLFENWTYSSLTTPDYALLALCFSSQHHPRLCPMLNVPKKSTSLASSGLPSRLVAICRETVKLDDATAMLAEALKNCTVQRFVGCAAPPKGLYALSVICHLSTLCIASVCVLVSSSP